MKNKLTKEAIVCYRANYSKKDWLRINPGAECFMMLPAGILDAVEELCSEVERLNGWQGRLF